MGFIMQNYIEVNTNVVGNLLVVKVVPILVRAANRKLATKGRVFTCKGFESNHEPFRRYMRRLHKIGFTSNYANQYWNKN